MKKEQDRGFWFKMTENKDVHLSPIARAQKLQLAFEQPSTGGCAAKDRRQEKWMTENEMARWHHQLDRHEFG